MFIQVITNTTMTIIIYTRSLMEYINQKSVIAFEDQKNQYIIFTLWNPEIIHMVDIEITIC